jgi:Ca2+-binding EF-hand superfamily protein
MNRKQLTIASAFVAALFAGGAVASESEQFTKLDANGDGAISMEEAAVDNKLTEAWSAIDANQDGKVESAEFSAFEEMSK